MHWDLCPKRESLLSSAPVFYPSHITYPRPTPHRPGAFSCPYSLAHSENALIIPALSICSSPLEILELEKRKGRRQQPPPYKMNLLFYLNQAALLYKTQCHSRGWNHSRPQTLSDTAAHRSASAPLHSTSPDRPELVGTTSASKIAMRAFLGFLIRTSLRPSPCSRLDSTE